MNPVTNAVVSLTGTTIRATEQIQGIVNTWSTESIVSQINQGLEYEAISDDNGQLIRYRYFATTFSTEQDRKAVVEKDRLGTAIEAAKIIGQEIIVDLDDERLVGPDYIDNWDINKLTSRVNFKAAKEGQYVKTPEITREIRYCEALRLAAKAGEAATINDGVDRVVETRTGIIATDDVLFVKALQAAGDSLKAQINSRRSGTDSSMLFYLLTPHDLTRVANTQAFTGSNVAGEALAKGSVGMLNGIAVYQGIRSKNISYCGIRGAVLVPIAAREMVTFPSKSNALKFGFEYALPAQGSEGTIYADGIIALGSEAVINA